MGGGALGSKNVSKLGSKEVSKNCHLERSERSQSYEILRLLTHSRKTDTLTLTSSARAPQNDNIFPLAPWRRADLRTDVAKRVRIANRLSGMHESAKAKLCERGANPRQGVRRTGEGSKVKIAQRVRDDMSILVHDNEIEKLDCYVADAPQNDSNRHAELVSASQNDTVFSRFTSNFSRKRVAFTLAEVLITLGIIGVVAALTIPSLVQNYKRTVVENKLKENYSLIYNAIRIAESKNGTMDEWQTCDVEFGLECTQTLFDKYLAPELKVIKTCTVDDEEECWTVPASLGGSKQYLANSGSGSRISVVLANGASLHMWAGSQTTGLPHIQIWMDIDGPRKGKGVIGSDVFGMQINFKESTKSNKGAYLVPMYIKANVNESYLRNTSLYGCKKTSSPYSGAYCGGLIQYNNWKIPKDYPTKF